MPIRIRCSEKILLRTLYCCNTGSNTYGKTNVVHVCDTGAIARGKFNASLNKHSLKYHGNTKMDCTKQF